MSRDYKTREPSAPNKTNSPMLIGIFIGLALGLLIAVGVAFYMSKLPTAFTNKTKPSEDVPVKGASAVVKPDDKTVKAGEKPRFDFYKILPGKEEVVSTIPDEKKVSPSLPGSHEIYYLQAGSFQNQSDADNLKAKLALMGLEASIQTADIPEKGLWHRVRLGPYTKLDDLNKSRSALAQNKIEASLIKVRDQAQ